MFSNCNLDCGHLITLLSTIALNRDWYIAFKAIDVSHNDLKAKGSNV